MGDPRAAGLTGDLILDTVLAVLSMVGLAIVFLAAMAGAFLLLLGLLWLLDVLLDSASDEAPDGRR